MEKRARTEEYKAKARFEDSAPVKRCGSWCTTTRQETMALVDTTSLQGGLQLGYHLGTLKW
jgi:hypothetical protein